MYLRTVPPIGTAHTFCAPLVWSETFSSPEAAILLVSTKDRDLWPAPRPEVRESRTHCQIWQICLAENPKQVFCACSKNRLRPEVSLLGADQKDCGLWGREWIRDIWASQGICLLIQRCFCAVYDYVEYADLSKGYQNPKRKLGVTVHFLRDN